MEATGRKPLQGRIPLSSRVGLQALSLLAIVVAYGDLRRIGARFGFATEVEYWLFKPSDNAPIAIVVLSAWLLYRRRDRFANLDPAQGSLALAVPALVLGTLGYAWAIHTSADALQVVSLVVNATGVVLLYWGTPGLRALWVPIFFLLFAVGIQAPLLNHVVFKLQIWTADYAGWLLYIVGVPALVSGDQILRATQAFQVVEGCSGLRSVETLTMLTVLLVDLFARRGWHAALLVLMAPPLAFALNGFRVLTLILNPHSEIVAIHNLQGIVILLLGLILIYLVDGLLERFELFAPPAPPAPPTLPAAPGADAEPPARSSARRAAVSVLTALACALTFVWLLVPEWEPASVERFDLAGIIDGAFEGRTSRPVDRDYYYQGRVYFQQQVDRRYVIDDHDQYVFVALADPIHRPGSAISPITQRPGSGWRMLEQE
ncbi:MAG: exosortase/archaeosortase family protein, partial [Deltaproteobacteria bacterium]|nr:exosortase/archaeosortase family protein [Deltaproteobacteria bacterium]